MSIEVGENSLSMQMASKIPDMNILFCAVHASTPFFIKKQVFDCCLLPSLLYGCETWITNNLKEVEGIYARSIKSLLSVRESTLRVNYMIQIAQRSLRTIVSDRRKSFLEKK